MDINLLILLLGVLVFSWPFYKMHIYSKQKMVWRSVVDSVRAFNLMHFSHPVLNYSDCVAIFSKAGSIMSLQQS